MKYWYNIISRDVSVRMHSKDFRSDDHWKGINVTDVILDCLEHWYWKHFAVTESKVLLEHVLTKPKLEKNNNEDRVHIQSMQCYSL